MASAETLDNPERPTAQHARWAALHPASLFPNLVTGVVIGALMVTFSISMATLLYGAVLPEHLDRAIGLALLSSLVVSLLVMLLGTGGSVVAHIQDAPTAVLATAAAGIVAALGAAGTSATSGTLTQFMTVSATVALTTLTTGAVLLLFGQFRLGRLVRYLPYPVIGGFMAGTGWLILTGGLSVMTGEPFGLELVRSLVAFDSLTTWLPGMALAVVLLIVSRRSPHFLAWPAVILGSTMLFYLVVLLGRRPIGEWRVAGYLLGPFPEADLLKGLAPGDLAFVDWSLVLAQLPTIITVAGLSLMAVLLNSTAIELMTNDRVDLDRELRATGIGNLLAGALGGQVGYQSVSMSNLNIRASTGGRTSLVVALIVVASTLLFGASLLEFVPTMVVGGLIAFLGIDFLYEWLVEAYSRLTLLEYAVVVVILVVIAILGFLAGVAVGLVLVVALFVVNYGRIDAVRHALDGTELRSRVRRDPYERDLIAASGAEVLILQLQGFLFFGTTNAVLERIEKRSSAGPLRSVILDFRRVTGVDADATLAMRRLLSSADGAGYQLYLSDLSEPVLTDFARRGLVAELEAGATIFPSLDAALEDSETRRLKEASVVAAAAISLEDSAANDTADPDSATDDSGALAAALGIGADASKVAPYLTRLELQPAERLITQGQPPNAVYFVAAGRLSTWLQTGTGELLRLESMRAGSVVGEVGFYTGEPRSASVVADEAAVVYQLSAEGLASLMAEQPALGAAVTASLAKLTAERVHHLMTTVTALQR